MKWDTACRATDDSILSFLSPDTQEPLLYFLSVISTDKPVSQRKHAFALTQLNVFAFRGFFSFMICTKNKEGVCANRATKYKNMWRENVLAHAHLWCGSTQIEY